MLTQLHPARPRRIDDWNGPGSGFTITDAVAYIDTVVLFCAHCLPKGELAALRKQYGRRLITRPHPVPGLPWARRRKLTIHRPTKATLEHLIDLQADRFVVHAVHLAIDFLCADRQQTDLATEFLTRSVVQNWRRRDHRSHLEQNTRYWKQDGKAPRNIALYGDRPSRTDIGPCTHFEMRFTSAEACARAGLGDLRQIADGVDAMSLLDHQARITPIDAKRLDRALENIARHALRNGQQADKTVSDIKERLRQLLARCLQDENRPLNGHSIAEARSQCLADCRPKLRGTLGMCMNWNEFTPTPRWHWW
jgi:hypothetical protein